MTEQSTGRTHHVLILAIFDVIHLFRQLPVFCDQRLEPVFYLRFLLGYGGELDLHILNGVFVALHRC